MIAFLVLAAVALFACGREAGPTTEALEDSIVTAGDERLDEEGSFSRVLDVRCGEGDGGISTCTVSIGAGVAGFIDTYEVRVGADGCWTGRRTELRHATGREAEDPLPEELEGCVR